MADYGGFAGILKEAQAISDENRRRESDPVACPKCGSTLQINSRGQKNCPMGHWRSGG